MRYLVCVNPVKIKYLVMKTNAERTKYLLTQVRSNQVIEELIILNKGLVYKQLTKFGMLNDHDAISLAYEALYIAINTYDISKDNAFSTYATVCIYNKLGSLVRKQKSSTNIDTVSYYAPVDGTDKLTYLEVLESDEQADTSIMRKQTMSNINASIERCYSKVKNPTHKAIISLWKDSNFTMTHLNISKEVNCSQTYVTRIINSFRAELKKHLMEG